MACKVDGSVGGMWLGVASMDGPRVVQTGTSAIMAEVSQILPVAFVANKIMPVHDGCINA